MEETNMSINKLKRHVLLLQNVFFLSVASFIYLCNRRFGYEVRRSGEKSNSCDGYLYQTVTLALGTLL
jgi:ABC-type uncharacterized transport system permease subunit